MTNNNTNKIFSVNEPVLTKPFNVCLNGQNGFIPWIVNISINKCEKYPTNIGKNNQPHEVKLKIPRIINGNIE